MGAHYFLVEWNIQPYYPKIKGDGSWRVISDSIVPFVELVKIRNVDDGEHYYLLETDKDSITGKVNTFIYDSKERKALDLNKYFKEPRIETPNFIVILGDTLREQYLRHIFAMYDSVVILSYYDSSLIFDLYRKKIIIKLPFAIQNLHRITDNRFLIISSDKMKEINKKGDILMY